MVEARARNKIQDGVTGMIECSCGMQYELLTIWSHL